MSDVFLDTGALIALTVRSDGLHTRAIEVRRSLTVAADRIVTTHWVLTEFLNAMAAPAARPHALRAVDALYQSERTSIVEASGEGWRAALELYRRRGDKGWSLVDCSSVALCEELGIRRVFTHDHHFQQAGFDVLLR